ncbi:hypothetical protein C8R42DRAFT_749220 [Lentinula raphanica]|nr:hypothetical protein C8R42DRAFT_749220 [Lentinula raphanica]
MTTEEAQQLRQAGASTFSTLMGLYISLFAIGMHVLITKKPQTWANQVLIGLVLTTFITTCLFFISDIIETLVLLKFGLIVTLPGGIATQENSASLQILYGEWATIESVADNTTYLIGDTIIAWRAWAMWSRNKIVHGILAIIVLGDIELGVNIADSIADSGLLLLSVEDVSLDWIATLISFAVNLVATSLIAYRAWTYHNSTAFSTLRKRTQVEAILLLVVESGAIFSVLQLASVIVDALDIHAANDSSLENATLMLTNLYRYTAALNPLALVVLVQRGITYGSTLQNTEVNVSGNTELATDTHA